MTEMGFIIKKRNWSAKTKLLKKINYELDLTSNVFTVFFALLATVKLLYNETIMGENTP